MPLPAPIFRVFVSSTFADLKAERDALQRVAFPRLRRFCEERGARFQPIDLRWGISEEAGHDHRTMAICLEEIARCRTLTPRPNFVVLLGERYGWQPLPARIPDADWRLLVGRFDRTERELFESWYRKDLNAVPAGWSLRARTGPYRDRAGWQTVERTLGAALRREAAGVLGPGAAWRYTASATEQEIEAGAFGIDDASDHVHGFLRTIDGLPRDARAGPYLDAGEDGSPDLERGALIASLRDRLRQHLPATCHESTARWVGDGVSDDHLGALCEDLVTSLSTSIERALAVQAQADPLELEVDAHLAMEGAHERTFVGRGEDLRRLGDPGQRRRLWGSAPDRQGTATVLVGGEGLGKSALLARLAASERAAGSEVVVRFLGTSAECSTLAGGLGSMAAEIARAAGAQPPVVTESPVEAIRELLRAIGARRTGRPLVMLLDGLDQVPLDAGTAAISWLPVSLPADVRLVVSSLPLPELEHLARHAPAARRIELAPMSQQDGATLLDRWLAGAGRTLQRDQRRRVLDAFAATGSPLQLRLAFEEARRWPSGASAEETRVHPGVTGAVERWVARLSSPSEHGPVLTRRVLGLLAAARHGLSEVELLDALEMDPAILDDLRRRGEAPPANQLPDAVWARLRGDLAPYLIERMADGSMLLTFFHRAIGRALTGILGSEDVVVDNHLRLARVFDRQPAAIGPSGDPEPNTRRLRQLPFHLRHAGRWDDLFAVLTDPDRLVLGAHAGRSDPPPDHHDPTLPYLARGTTRRGPAWLHDDLRAAIAGWPADAPGSDERTGQRRELQMLADAIALESTVLSRRPDLVTQQLANRIPDDGARIGARLRDFADRTAHETGRPWVRLARPLVAPSGMVRIIGGGSGTHGHRGPVLGCGVLPDGRTIISFGSDATLRTWDIESSAERWRVSTLERSNGDPKLLAIDPDGTVAATADWQGGVLFWDIGTTSGTARAEVASVDSLAIAGGRGDRAAIVVDGGHLEVILGDRRRPGSPEPGSDVLVCAIEPGGRAAYTGHADGTITIRDPRSGRTVGSVRAHRAQVVALAIDASGARLVSGGEDGVLRLWDAATLRLVAEVASGSPINGACAVSIDGRVAAVVRGTGPEVLLAAWDTSTGESLGVVTGIRPTCCALGADGTTLVSGHADGSLRVWDLGPGRRLGADRAAETPRHPREVVAETPARSRVLPPALHADPGGGWYLSTGGGLVVAWDAIDGRALATFTGLGCAVIEGGARIVVLEDPTTLTLVETEAWRPLRSFAGTGHWAGLEMRPATLAVSPDGARAFTVTQHGALCSWQLATGHLERIVQYGVTEILGFTQDGEVVSGHRDGTVAISGHGPGARVRSFRPRGSRHVLGAGGTLLWSHDPDGMQLTAWDLASGDEGGVALLTGSRAAWEPQAIRECLGTGDPAVVATRHADGMIATWDATTLDRLAVLRHHEAEGFRASPDGSMLATWGPTGSVVVWDLTAGSQLATIVLPESVEEVLFHPTSRAFAMIDAAGTVHVATLAGSDLTLPVNRPTRFVE